MMRQGYVAEFRGEEELLEAAQAMRRAGYSQLDAFTPYPVQGLDQVLGVKRSRLALVIFPLAILGAFLGYGLQWLLNAFLYPIDVGGRPMYSWPAYIPITFESGVLTSGILTFVLFLAFNRYPEPHAPIFAVPGFERASVETFWLAVDRGDPRFEPKRVVQDLRATDPMSVAGVGMELP